MNISLGGHQGDVKIHQGLPAGKWDDFYVPPLLEELLALYRLPAIGRDQPAVDGTGLFALEAPVDNPPRGGPFSPEINPIHLAVGKPQGAGVRMVGTLPFRRALERIVTSQVASSGIAQWVEIRLVEALASVDITAEDLAIDIDAAGPAPLRKHLDAILALGRLAQQLNTPGPLHTSRQFR